MLLTETIIEGQLALERQVNKRIMPPNYKLELGIRVVEKGSWKEREVGKF